MGHGVKGGARDLQGVGDVHAPVVGAVAGWSGKKKRLGRRLRG